MKPAPTNGSSAQRQPSARENEKAIEAGAEHRASRRRSPGRARGPSGARRGRARRRARRRRTPSSASRACAGRRAARRAAITGISTVYGIPIDAHERQQEQRGADGHEAGARSEAGRAARRAVASPAAARSRGREPHRQQRGDHGEVRDARRSGSTTPSPTAAMIDAADRRADDAAAVDHRRVEGDRVRQVGAVLDHLDDERLPRRRVERVDDPLDDLQHEHVPATVITPASVSAGEQRSDCSIDSDLRDDQDAMRGPSDRPARRRTARAAASGSARRSRRRRAAAPSR